MTNQTSEQPITDCCAGAPEPLHFAPAGASEQVLLEQALGTWELTSELKVEMLKVVTRQVSAASTTAVLYRCSLSCTGNAMPGKVY